MSMKVDIEIVTGFLGAGKTSFVNGLIKNALVSKEKLLVIQCEKGERNIEEDILRNSQIVVKQYEPTKLLTENYLKNMINGYSPHKIIIEYNGTRNIDELLSVLNKKELKKMCCVSTIFNISDAVTFNLFLNNLGGVIVPSIRNCNLAVINNACRVSKEELDTIKTEIESLNPKAYVVEAKESRYLESILSSEEILDTGLLKKFTLLLRNFYR